MIRHGDGGAKRSLTVTKRSRSAYASDNMGLLSRHAVQTCFNHPALDFAHRPRSGSLV